MGRKHAKPISIGKITAKQRFDWSKPLYNGHAIGTGVLGDTKYNRRKNKEETKRLIDEAL